MCRIVSTAAVTAAMQEAIFTLRIDRQPAHSPPYHHLSEHFRITIPYRGSCDRTTPAVSRPRPAVVPKRRRPDARDETGDGTGPNHGQRQGSEAGVRGRGSRGQRRGSEAGVYTGSDAARDPRQPPPCQNPCRVTFSAAAPAPAATTRDYGRARGTARTVSHVRRRRRTTLPMPPSPTAPQVVKTPVPSIAGRRV